MKLLIFSAIAMLLLILVSGIYVFIVACVRRKDLPWLVEEDIKKTPYGKYYECMADADRWFREHNAQDIFIQSADGLKLHGLWVEAPDAKGTMLLAHGYRSTMLLDFGTASAFYYELGYNILVPDQRCHGRSQGRFITFGVKESDDFLRWIAYHNQFYADLPIILSGMSMGASTVMYLADKSLPTNIKGIIADCGFTSPKDILSVVFRKITHLPAGPSVFVADICARSVAGFNLNQKDTRRSLSKCHLPVLLIHGKSDGFVPCRMSEEAYGACISYKELLLIDGADHGVSFLRAPDRYSETVVRFINNLVTNKGE